MVLSLIEPKRERNELYVSDPQLAQKRKEKRRDFEDTEQSTKINAIHGKRICLALFCEIVQLHERTVKNNANKDLLICRASCIHQKIKKTERETFG